ncbi:MAG: helix-turn-helix domain-containing protein [Verrucomicrobiota bacterium]
MQNIASHSQPATDASSTARTLGNITPLLYGRREAARRIPVSVRTLDGFKSRRKIGFVKIGGKVLFRESDIAAFIARHVIAPRAGSGAI